MDRYLCCTQCALFMDSQQLTEQRKQDGQWVLAQFTLKAMEANGNTGLQDQLCTLDSLLTCRMGQPSPNGSSQP